jgi:aspartyl-tRNA(Asn)/glutamyl-tRNA(Gln) amidotransferase subunit A
MPDLISRPLVEIAQELRERRLTSQEVVEAAIARHERFGERLHAYCHWTPDRARESAKAADAAFASGAVVGPLQGVPISIKDLFAAEGFPCFAGSSRRLPPDPWEKDGPLVATVRRQLGVITGKTHMVEFAFGGTGLNSHWNAPYNPWDASAHRSPGGSSSGAGVSLLEGSALLALGSDTAGSVRIPACMTGNVGLKVALGRWSTEGVVPLSGTFDTPGLLARSVSDAAYGFAALDPALGDAERFIAKSSTVTLNGIRIGIDDPLFWDDCDPGIVEAPKDAVDALAGEGAVLRKMTLPEAAGAYAVFLEGSISAIELRSFLGQELPDWLPQLDPIMASAVHGAEAVTAIEYLSRLGR